MCTRQKRGRIRLRFALVQTHLDPKSLIITADQGMVEQVLINIIKNAIQALQEMSDEERRENADLVFSLIEAGKGGAKGESRDLNARHSDRMLSI